MTALLRLDAVTMERGGRLLAQGLDLLLEPGERLHVAGPNGCGKSSLIRLAAGLLRPAAGSVERAAAALADDTLPLDGERPLARALAFWAPPGRVAAALDQVGLAPLADLPVRLLSAGQRKRAALARVAASDAPLWLLDEPLNALDGEGAARLAALIDGHCASGGAVLAASHLDLPGQWRTMELAR